MEAPVDGRLDALAERVEQDRDEQGRGGDGDALVLDQRAHVRHQEDVRSREHAEQDDGHQAVTDRLADDAVDVVEAIAQDRDRDGDGWQQKRCDPGDPHEVVDVLVAGGRELTGDIPRVAGFHLANRSPKENPLYTELIERIT
jgi:hypothetical protein